MSDFVPGPWAYNPFLPSVKAGDKVIAWVRRSGCGDAAHPTAHLIAAAPELLEALQALLADHEKYCEHGSFESADAARAAIAKALATGGDK